MHNLFSILSILIFLIFSACTQSTSNKNAVLPDSNGGIDEILIVADPVHLADSTKDILYNTFSGQFDVLPQFEPKLTSRFISYNKMTNLLSRFRTIIIVADLEKEGKAKDFTLENVPEEVLKSGEQYFYIKRNAWAEPQIIIFLFAYGKENLWQNIVEQGDYLTQVIHKYQEPFLKKILFAKDHNYSLEKKLKEKYHIKMDIPKDYTLSLEEDNFLWIRKETGISSENYLIYFQDYAFDKDIDNLGISWRNDLGKKYISTDVDSSYMTTDSTLRVLAAIKSLNGVEYLENRGLWKVVNDFMGGPFMNYLIPDEKNQRLIMLDAFVHAPGEKKKILMRKAEVVFNSLEIEN